MKRILVFFSTFVLCLSVIFSPCAFAEPICDLDPVLYAAGSTASPQAEETMWVYRVYNGNREKRLWSITYNKWLTDWIIIGPA